MNTDTAPEIVFDPKAHRYRVNGKFAPSVTTITGSVFHKPALVFWAAKQASEYYLNTLHPPSPKLDPVGAVEFAREMTLAHTNTRDATAGIGTRVHAWIEKRLQAQMRHSTSLPDLPYDDGDALGPCASWLDWWEASGLTPVGAERIVAHTGHWYAGTFDALAVDDDGTVIVIDWKTSSSLYAEKIVQSALYGLALRQQYQERVDRVGVVTMPRDGSPAKCVIEPLDDKLCAIAESCIQLFSWYNTTERQLKARNSA